MDVDKANQLFEQHGFVYAKTLFKGSLSECLKYPNSFLSTNPTEWGLPGIEGNIAEGVIIRPLEAGFLHTGSRIIIKKKNNEWSDNHKNINKKDLDNALNEKKIFSNDELLLIEKILLIIHPNRLNNVLSKLGEVDIRKDFGRLLGLYNREILEELFKENKDLYENLEKQQQKSINRFINSKASEAISNFFEI